MTYIVREEFRQAGFETPTQRHYPIRASNPSEALRIVREARPYWLNGVQYGLVKGSKLTVVGKFK
jgi:hypothetical protein